MISELLDAVRDGLTLVSALDEPPVERCTCLLNNDEVNALIGFGGIVGYSLEELDVLEIVEGCGEVRLVTLFKVVSVGLLDLVYDVG